MRQELLNDEAYLFTMAELKMMNDYLTAVYQNAQNEIRKEMTDYLAESNKEASRLLAQWEKARDSGSAVADTYKKKYDKFVRSQTITSQKFQNKINLLSKYLTNVDKIAQSVINNEQPKIYALNYNSLGEEVKSAMNGISFNLLNTEAINYIALQDPDLLPTRNLNFDEQERWNKEKFNQAVLQTIVTGEPLDKLAERISKTTGANKVQAQRAARTAYCGAMNKGRLDAQRNLENRGVILNKVWQCTFVNSREHHMQMDGESVATHEEFSNGLMYPGDPSGEPKEVYNCRCSLVTDVVGFDYTGTDLEGDFEIMDDDYEFGDWEE